MIYMFNNGQQHLKIIYSSSFSKEYSLLNSYVQHYIRAVIAAAKPKKMPGALANATGISLCSLNKP